MTIPKNIFQSWKHNKGFPEHPYPVDLQIDSVKQYNSDYNYQLFTDEMIGDFVKDKFPDFAYCFEKLPPIKKADIWRYMVLYEYGGIYLDIDCICLKSFDDLINTDAAFIVGKEYNANDKHWGENLTCSQESYANWIILSEAKNPVLEKMLEKALTVLETEENLDYQALSYDEWKENVLTTTGPFGWSEVIRDSNDDSQCLIGSKDWFAVGESIFQNTTTTDKIEQRRIWDDAINQFTMSPGPYDGEDVYLLHTYLGTWKNWYKPTDIKGKLKRKLKRILR